MNSVKASSVLAPGEFLARIRALALAQGFRVEPYGEIDGYPLLSLTRRTPGPKPRIYLSAGIHGDEPAGPLALLRLLEQGFFGSQAVWFLCPALNPVGLSRNTRENADGIDLNRDYRGTRSHEIQAHLLWLRSQPNFDLTLCLHEDWESVGFYLYERNPDKTAVVAEAMIQAIAQVCPIEHAGMIDGRPAREGIIRGLEDVVEKELWPEAVYLWLNHAKVCYTTESPSALPLEQRVAAQCVAIETAVQSVVRPSAR